MKHIYILLISALCLLSISLQARTVEEARAIASTFIQLQSTTTPAQRMQKAASASAVTAPVELAFTQYQVDQTTPAVYVFNSSDKGFVLVSAEDNARAVLGYADNGEFDENNIPENMRFWLQMYADEIGRLGDEAIRRKAKGEKILELTHVLSHQKLHARFIIKNVSELPEIPDTLVVSLSNLDNYAFSRLTLNAIEKLL